MKVNHKSRTKSLLSKIDKDIKLIKKDVFLEKEVRYHFSQALELFKELIVDKEFSMTFIEDVNARMGIYMDSIKFYRPNQDISIIRNKIIGYSDFAKYELPNIYNNIENLINYNKENALL